jgi:hypothetical protein
MSENNSIGLAELIEQVKRELLTDPHREVTDVPFLAVDTVELELQVTVKKEGKTGIKINVLTVGGELGGGISRDSVQKVKVTLSPLFSKEKLLEDYLKRHPEQIQKLSETSIGATFKNVDDGSSVGQQF